MVDTAHHGTRSSRPHSLPLNTRTGTRPTLRQRRRHPAPRPRARGRRASTTRRPRRPPKALVPVTPRPSAATGFVPQGVRRLRRRTPASPTRSIPGCRQQAEGQSQVRGGKPTARPGTDLWRPPSSPAADAAVCTHGDACVTSGNALASLPLQLYLVTVNSAHGSGFFSYLGKGYGSWPLRGQLPRLHNSKQNVKEKVYRAGRKTELSQLP